MRNETEGEEEHHDANCLGVNARPKKKLYPVVIPIPGGRRQRERLSEKEAVFLKK